MIKPGSYKKQETLLILLNMSVIAALVFVHISFIGLLGRPSGWLLLILAIRFILLNLELIWVQKTDDNTPPGLINAHIYLSLILNMVFAFLAARSGGTADSHYSVLMVIPIISAAYRFRLIWTMLVVIVAIALNFLEVYFYFTENPPVDISEYFEAATVSLVFLVVGIIVWLLVGSLRSEEEKLNHSLDELRELQSRLVAEEKLAAIGQLSSAIAHEIRNPVSMIASSLKLAEKQLEDSSVRKEMFDIATAEATRLELLTTDFLAFARAKEPERKEVAVRENLEYIAGLSRAKLAEKDLTLEIRCPTDITFSMDQSQMQQALLNLMTNSVSAAPEGTAIVLGAEKRGALSVLFVENEGPRIPDEIVDRIFEPFFTGKERGTGLGLSIVRTVARGHGGEVSLVKNLDGNVRFEIAF